MKIQIGTIPENEYYNYRLDVIFDSYKWDLQANDQSTISDKVVLLNQETINFLAKSAVALYNETMAMEEVIKKRPDLMLKMGISPTMADALFNCQYNQKEHLRLMRFDYHPTKAGWKISEVNSDVPAGYPEASILPQLAEKYFPKYQKSVDTGKMLVDGFLRIAPANSHIAYLHDTQTVEDYQILHFIGDMLKKHGHEPIYMSPADLKWEDNEAINAGAIMRYYPVEWLEYEEGADWLSFINTKTPSCNHPTALLTQSKRLPLIWDELKLDLPFWKQLLPETKCLNDVKNDNGWILKPAFGRVGEGINIPKAVSKVEDSLIRQAAKDHPNQWVMQKMFESLPIEGLHLSLGVFVIDGKFAGLYGRTSKLPRIDSEASEVPVLVKKESL
ncbi:MAG: glutathionylspermidine synthase family protein [Erysipelotrichales bacterium]|nr:glutathionylspermidine synthase family protein [Erysipelotrichales bacterium]